MRQQLKQTAEVDGRWLTICARCHRLHGPVLCPDCPTCSAACCVQTECRLAAISDAAIYGRGCVAKAVSYCCTPGAVPPPPQPVYPPHNGAGYNYPASPPAAPYNGYSGYNPPSSNYDYKIPAAYEPYPNSPNTPAAYEPYPNTNYPNTNYPGYQKSS
jgi:hypothetical protein